MSNPSLAWISQIGFVLVVVGAIVGFGSHDRAPGAIVAIALCGAGFIVGVVWTVLVFKQPREDE
ncbi:hypothetical protein [Curtobacterium sp. Leaf261]|uniref:hypothetical protein n=1 Tax=Curtobacterium sp. Leaf261 TaxID=1736311 RepID=UPI0006F4336F|nr:hypothetical protein [Curtobacterium sp. Leaf261]KQO59982.1 hypothetical protein ASF23_15125 [Curtobacterium sp. Leaf261]